MVLPLPPRRPKRSRKASSCGARIRRAGHGGELPWRNRRADPARPLRHRHLACRRGFALSVRKVGAYALFIEHHPLEFGLHLAEQPPVAERKFASHHHEDDISSIGISDPRPLDPAKLNQWLDYLLKTRGQDIFRMKGVLNVKGEDRRQVFHGVHMMFDSQPERPWGTAPRVTTWCSSGAAWIARNSKPASSPRSPALIRPTMAKQSLSFALEPRVSAAFDDYVADCAWSRGRVSLAVAGGEGKVALARIAGAGFCRSMCSANIC